MRARSIVAITSVAFVAMLSSCSSGSHIPYRTVFVRAGALEPGGDLRPGARLGIVGSHIENKSPDPVTILSVEIEGQSFGSVARVSKLGGLLNRGGIHAFPGGAWATDPPVWYDQGRCYSPLLAPIRGFEVPPHQTMRLWLVMRALTPGLWKTAHTTVVYEQRGWIYQQVLASGFYGGVRDDGSVPVPDKSERPCISVTRPLN
jgi:hypothetical protein